MNPTLAALWAKFRGVVQWIVMGALALFVYATHSKQVAPPEPAPVAPIPKLAAVYNTPIAQGIFDIRTFGAVGDFVHDDTAAINAANNAAQAANGTVYLPPPPVAYRVTSEIPIHWPAHWQGAGTNYTQTSIKAANGSGLRSVIELRPAFAQQSSQAFGPCDYGCSRAILEGFTVDANDNNGGARHAVLLTNAEGSVFRHMRVINAQASCVRSPQIVYPANFGTVVAGGTAGSPTGVTVSQADPNYLLANVYGGGTMPPPTNTIVIKIQAGGALGTATYVSNLNGGAFSSFALPVRSQIQLANPDPGAMVQAGTGILVNFPAGTYQAGSTYTFTLTLTGADYAIGTDGGPNNFAVPLGYGDMITYSEVDFANCGTVWATSAIQSTFNGGPPVIQTASGTMNTTAGSQVITGTGTHWLSAQNECAWGRGIITDGTHFYAMLAVLDDTDLVVGPETALVPTATATNLQYAMACGAAFYEDSGSKDGGITHFEGGQIGNSAIGLNVSYNTCPKLDRLRITSTWLEGAVAGEGSQVSPPRCMWESPYIGGAVTGAHGQAYYLGTTSSGTLLENGGVNGFVIGGSGQKWWTCADGVCSPIVNINLFGSAAAVQYGQFWAANMVPTNVSISAANQQLPKPDMQLIGSSQSASMLYNLTANASYTLTATPLIPSLGANQTFGQIIVLHNGGAGTALTLRDHFDTGSGLLLDGAYVTIDYEDNMWLMSTSNPGVYQQMSPVFHTYRRPGVPLLGSQGSDSSRWVTTNNTPLTTQCWQVGTNGGTNAGTIKKVDIMAESNNGATTNVAAWLNFMLAWDKNGTALTGSPFPGTTFGTNGGAPPAGWAVTWPGSSSTNACVQVTGDNSGNNVTWTFAVNNRDPGMSLTGGREKSTLLGAVGALAVAIARRRRVANDNADERARKAA